MTNFSRRTLLSWSAAAMGTAALPRPWMGAAIAAEPETTVLRVETRTIQVNRKPAKVFGLYQPDGTWGMVSKAGRFRVRLENSSDAPTLIHWHGLLPPYGQDGVPDMPQPLLASGQSYDYDFPLDTPGTHWMHAHTLQEQQLLAAPLIVTDPGDAALDEQPVAVLFSDFSFRSPDEILTRLRHATGTGKMAMRGATSKGSGGGGSMSAMPGMAQGSMAGHNMAGMPATAGVGMAMDVNDIDYDAYLANDRSLNDPAVFRVEPGAVVRLRLINGGTATGFWVELGALAGEAIAVDGNPIIPVAGRRFPLGMGQRIDIRVRLPKNEGAWPILALREGAKERTGFVLATKSGVVHRIEASGAKQVAPLDLSFESGLRIAKPVPEKAVSRRDTVLLGGDMAAYVWTLDGQAWPQHRPLAVSSGERIEVTIRNQSMMSHPMHLHGHHFQVVAIDGSRLLGAVRDTVWVPPAREVTVAFDANNPGEWAFHCHHLYHMATGMMTTVSYAA
jgi:FtsP/CotA-like multicopper oxidase with cupredoxin domain